MKITDLFAPFPDQLELSPRARVPEPLGVEWASGFGDLFFRPQGANPEMLWCVLGRGAPTKRPLSSARLKTLNTYLSAAYAGRTFFRVVPLSDGDDWALVRPKRALVKSLWQKKGAIWQWSASFPAPQGQLEWLSQPLNWFEEWLPDPRALQAPREFARWSDDDRMWLPLSRDAAARAQWNLLTPALQKLSYSALNPSVQSWHLFGQNGTGAPIYPLYQLQKHPLAHSILALASALQETYPLHYQSALWRGIGVRGKKSKHIAPSYKAARPSQHEVMEAALLWRDFGRKSGESARVETALNELLR